MAVPGRTCLLGVANSASIAIQIGGRDVLAAERKTDVALFGLWATSAGNLTAFISASWAGKLP